jgi:hypothetical protein
LLRAVARALGIRSEETVAKTVLVLTNGEEKASVRLGRRCEYRCATQPECLDLNRVTPIATDGDRQPAVSVEHTNEEEVGTEARISAPIMTVEARPPTDHAEALLSWLQGPGGRSGTIVAAELEQMHREMCDEFDWEVVGWVAVGRELRRLLRAKKDYARLDGRRVRVYRIPPARMGRTVPFQKAA